MEYHAFVECEFLCAFANNARIVRRWQRRWWGPGKFYGVVHKDVERGTCGVEEQQRLSSDQGSLRATPLVCAEVRRARLWRVLSSKNVLVARSFTAPDGSLGKETKAGIRVKCNHSSRVSIEREHPDHTQFIRRGCGEKDVSDNATCR